MPQLITETVTAIEALILYCVQSSRRLRTVVQFAVTAEKIRKYFLHYAKTQNFLRKNRGNTAAPPDIQSGCFFMQTDGMSA
ncbi:hypothetical protein [Caproicibacter sp. BJN0012]|uniref:hypothetical protein n=1 Tax=Caproicibacter sp. BJN0012 TaxID=3110227 RepID=UPI002E0DDDA4